MLLRQLLLLGLGLFVVPTVASADDWPQWMGPQRDNVWREQGILDKFPEGGPKIVWRTPIAAGYAGPAVANGKVYITDRVLGKGVANPADPFDTKDKISSTERVLCLDEKTGKEVWKHEYDCPYQISYPSGPRCTPLVHEGKVYTLGAMGNLFCFDAATGKIVWSKDLKSEYKAKPALWGYAAHPLIDGKKLITIGGNSEDSHIVALDKDTGKELWKAGTQTEPGYSPVLITEAGGKRQMIVASPKAVYSLNPETGEKYWTTPYSADSGCVIMTPMRVGDHIFVGGYEHKNLLLKLTSDKPGVEVVWKDKKEHAVSPVSVQPFLQDGVLYGFDDDGTMYGVEMPSGKRLWDGTGPFKGEPKASATAFIVKNGDRFFFFAETGDLVIARLTPKGYEEISRAKVIEQTNNAWGRKVVWSAPAYADKKAFIRNDKEIICVDLAK
jgi:outer membrane protein assembly factor BamB